MYTACISIDKELPCVSEL